jgi:predicted RNA-binding Zn-ribbon protein involved in translation (DUF1610 family)
MSEPEACLGGEPHSYEARYDRESSRSSTSHCSHTERRRTYLYDICPKCGHIIKRDEAAEKGDA